MPNKPSEQALRRDVVAAMRQLVEAGLTSGTSGNVSRRSGSGMLITPTGVAPAQLQATDIVFLELDGSRAGDQLVPSSEWRMHADIYAAQADVGAVVHCHSTYATILACARRAIPAMHYMVAAAGGDCIPLADYATFGTGALSTAALVALTDTRACLLANHGQIATGEDLGQALSLAALVEEQAHWYWGALAIGDPVILSETEMRAVTEAFRGYGQQNAPE